MESDAAFNVVARRMLLARERMPYIRQVVSDASDPHPEGEPGDPRRLLGGVRLLASCAIDVILIDVIATASAARRTLQQPVSDDVARDLRSFHELVDLQFPEPALPFISRLYSLFQAARAEYQKNEPGDRVWETYPDLAVQRINLNAQLPELVSAHGTPKEAFDKLEAALRDGVPTRDRSEPDAEIAEDPVSFNLADIAHNIGLHQAIRCLPGVARPPDDLPECAAGLSRHELRDTYAPALFAQINRTAGPAAGYGDPEDLAKAKKHPRTCPGRRPVDITGTREPERLLQAKLEIPDPTKVTTLGLAWQLSGRLSDELGPAFWESCG
jgi:hypothetical protein